jgi:hypothetical protein
MDKVTTTHRRAANMLQTLQGMKDILGSTNIRFPYAVAKNTRYLEQHIVTLRELTKPDESFMKFDKERVDLNIKYSQKDGRGRPRTANNSYIIDPEKQADFDNELIALREQYQGAIMAQEDKTRKVESMLDDSCEIELYSIKLSWVPTSVKPGDMEILMDLIIDDMLG